MLWDVRRVVYATYMEIDERWPTWRQDGRGGEAVIVARRLPLQAAIAEAERLGFGHSVHPTGG